LAAGAGAVVNLRALIQIIAKNRHREPLALAGNRLHTHLPLASGDR
jgi:hypothetical protein